MNVEDDDDTHFCLKCRTTIVGLHKYIQHKTAVCPSSAKRKNNVSTETDDSDKTTSGMQNNSDVSEKEIALLLSTLEQHPPAIHRLNSQHQSTDDVVLNPLVDGSNKPTNELFIPNYTDLGDGCPKDGTREQCDVSGEEVIEMNNFLSSLELKSNKEVNSTQNEQTEFTNLLGPPDLADDQNLPISTLLKDLEFSSDSEPDLGEYLTHLQDERADRSQNQKRPSPRHKETGGKYKPWGRSRSTSSGKLRSHGERQRVTSNGGKWKPDCWKSADDRLQEKSSSVGKCFTEQQEQPHDDYYAPPHVVAAIQAVQSNVSFVDCTAAVSAPQAQIPAAIKSPSCTLLSPVVVTSSMILSVAESGTSHVAPSYGGPDDCITTADISKQSDSKRESSRKKRVPVSRSHSCTVCKRQFSNRYIMARHLLTRMHHNRALSRREEAMDMMEEYHDLVIRLSPFQCQICQFYCHSNKDLLSHLMSEGHLKTKDDILGPQFCVLCRFTTEEQNELIEHFRTEEHETMVLSQSEHRPCVVREKRTSINCPQCDAIVASSKRLRMHKEIAHGSRKRGPRVRVNRTCGYCNKIFCTQKAMAIHVRRIHTKERPYECKECDKSFTDKYSLADHEKTKMHLRNVEAAVQGLAKHGRKSTRRKSGHKCEHCDYVASDYAALRPHYLTKHANVDVSCDLCGLEFMSSSALHSHKKSRRHINLEKAEKTNGSLVSCDLCSRKFADEKKMTLHRLIHQSRVGATNDHQYAEFLRSILPNTKKVKCPVCSTEIGRQNIAAHLRRHEQVFPYSCRICDKRFVSSDSMRLHLKEHAGLFTKKCPHCERVFTSRSPYAAHIAQHTVPEESRVRCRLCPKTFTHQWKLNQHYKTKHDDKTLRCSQPGCNMAFNRQCDFTKHARTHTNERLFLCDMCGFKCPTKLGLQRHHLVHSNERSYKCEHCPYKAKLYSHLRRHIRIHIGCKPFKCPYCEYACNTIENIRTHIRNSRKHSGKSVYLCPLEGCGFGTDSAKEFRAHLPAHPGYENVNVMSIFTGIYAKNEDTTVPEEGAQVLPSRERRFSRRRQRKGRTDSQDCSEFCGESLERGVSQNDEVHGRETTLEDVDNLDGELIEVEIVNPDGEEIELSPENINLLVQQALFHQQSEGSGDAELPQLRPCETIIHVAS